MYSSTIKLDKIIFFFAGLFVLVPPAPSYIKIRFVCPSVRYGRSAEVI